MAWSDNFTRADGPLGNGWLVVQGAPAIVGNQASVHLGDITVNSNTTVAGDHDASVVSPGCADPTYARSPIVKGANAGFHYYGCQLYNVGGTWYGQIVRADNSAPTQIAYGTYGGPLSGSITLRLTYLSGVVTMYANGTQICQVGDSYLDAYTYCGMVGLAVDGLASLFTGGAPTPPASMAVTPDPLWMGAPSVACVATLSGAAWTPGVPGSSTITADHGSISDQWTADATHIHFTYTPAEYIGTLTFTESEFSLEDTVTAVAIMPEGWTGGGGAACPFDEDFVDLANRSGHLDVSGELLTTSEVVTETPAVLGILDSLAFLVHYIHYTQGYTGGVVPPDTRLDVIWDWISGGAELVGLPQTPTTSTPLKTDTERIYAFLKALPLDYEDMGAVVGALGGTPFSSHHDIMDAIAAIPPLDLSTVLTRLDEIQGVGAYSIYTITTQLDAIVTNHTYNLENVKEWIDGRANESTLVAGIAELNGVLAGLALEIAGIGAAETADAASSATAATAAGGALAWLLLNGPTMLSDLASIVDALRSPSSTAVVAPIWPGVARVTYGDAIAIESNVEIPGPMHGVEVEITQCESGTRFFDYDGVKNWSHVGALTFFNDANYSEPFQVLGSARAFYTPKTMAQASVCRLYRSRNVRGTIRPWTINP